MKLLLAFFLLFSAGAATLKATWQYDFANAVVCSTAAPVNCLDHFEVGLLSGTGVFTTLNNTPIPASPSGVVSVASPSFTVNSGFGTAVVSVVMVAKDSAGNRVTSSPQAATVSITIAPSNPSGLIVTTSN